MNTLTPLEEIPGFSEAVREPLARYWIGSAEELVGTARAGNQQFGSGLAAAAYVSCVQRGRRNNRPRMSCRDFPSSCNAFTV